jgi:tetratricopeptide (TPR) repeat protein
VIGPVVYLWQTVWPVHLFLPHLNPTQDFPVWEVALALGLLAAVSIAALVLRRKRPYLLVGWFWYLGMLFPVLGIIPSRIAYADRYTYLPQIGLLVALVWGGAELAAAWRVRPGILATVSAGVVLALGALAFRQTRYWRDSETLWRHTLACSTGNAIAHYDLGNALALKGELDQAIAQYQDALDIDPDNAEAHNNLGKALALKGKLDEAIAQYKTALAIQPELATVNQNLGNALLQKGDYDQALACFEKTLPGISVPVEQWYNLGNDFLRTGDFPDAAFCYRHTLSISPHYADAYANLGVIYYQQGRTGNAIDAWRQALALNPGQLYVQNNLAWSLATATDASLRNGAQAVSLAEQAVHLTNGANPMLLRTLAAAYAEAGRYSEAAHTAQSAWQIANAQGDAALAETLQHELKLYAGGMPVRDAKP